MAEATYSFPKGFLWGTATSSYQVEGNNKNTCWWAFEQEQGRIFNGDKSGFACDWWGGRWKEDLDRAQAAYQNAHRLSIEWARVQPIPGKWDEDALERYREILRGVSERKMTAMVTLHHFNDPIWFMEKGGWENENAVDLFVGYVNKVVEALREYCNLWVTINEPNLWVLFGYITGVFPPGKRDFKAAIRAAINLSRAHAAAYRIIHQLQSEARVGVAHHHMALAPVKKWFPLDWWATNLLNLVLNDLFPNVLLDGVLRFPVTHKRIPEAKGTQDFFGLNYYTKARISFDLLNVKEMFTKREYAPDKELSDGGWLANAPEGFFEAIKWSLKQKLPVIITENGVNDAQDTLRPRYMLQHLHQVWRAVNFNFPIKGYFHWTLVDNFEWERGWSQQFGLWALDKQTQTRTKRQSADLYAAICKENAISSQVVESYTPELSSILFPV